PARIAVVGGRIAGRRVARHDHPRGGGRRDARRSHRVGPGLRVGLRARAPVRVEGARVDPLGSVFAALSDTSRRHLVETLAQRDSATLGELARELPITRQAVSKHLASLGEAGLVEATRSGRNTHYRLTPGALDDASGW